MPPGLYYLIKLSYRNSFDEVEIYHDVKQMFEIEKFPQPIGKTNVANSDRIVSCAIAAQQS